MLAGRPRAEVERLPDRAGPEVADRQLAGHDEALLDEEDGRAGGLVQQGRDDAAVRDAGRAVEVIGDRVARVTVSPLRRKRSRRPIGLDAEQPKQPPSFGKVSSVSSWKGIVRRAIPNAASRVHVPCRPGPLGVLGSSRRMFDLSYTAAEEAFRAELRAWLAAHLPAGTRPPEDEIERRRFQRAWQRDLAAGGWVGIQWPREYGGRGAGLKEQIIFTEEMARARAPEILDPVSVNIVGPTLIRFGTAAQKARWLPRIRPPTRSGASASRSRTPARTWPRSAAAPCATTTTGW